MCNMTSKQYSKTFIKHINFSHEDTSFNHETTLFKKESLVRFMFVKNKVNYHLLNAKYRILKAYM